jgi:hypothetical protein
MSGAVGHVVGDKHWLVKSTRKTICFSNPMTNQKGKTMRYQSIKQIAGLGLVVAALAFPSLSRADYTVDSGWDLFTTQPGTMFDYVPFLGVPLTNFDFGGSIGVKNVGSVDTIMYRPTDITNSSGGTVGFTADMVAFQLRTVSDQVNFGAGPGYYYLTLDPNYTSTADGMMYFNPDDLGGTFSSSVSVYYDLRYLSLDGLIVFGGNAILTNSGAFWDHTSASAPVITGVNYLLNGTDTSEDFWPGMITYTNGFGDVHIVPEPSVCSLAACLGGGLIGLWQMRRKLLRK